MCIDLQYFYPMCQHYEYVGWMCRNLYWNEFCDSPYVEDEVIDGERCAWCNTMENKRKVGLKEMRGAEIIDLVEDEEDIVVKKKTKKEGYMKEKEKKITDHFFVAKSKSGVAGPTKAA